MVPIKHTIQDLRNLYGYCVAPYGLRSDVSAELYFERFGPPVRFAQIRVAWRSVTWVSKAVRCAFTGHRWVDDSCAGPDSGDISMFCARCGYTFHKQLY